LYAARSVGLSSSSGGSRAFSSVAARWAGRIDLSRIYFSSFDIRRSASSLPPV
jgi:hypothetical protein